MDCSGTDLRCGALTKTVAPQMISISLSSPSHQKFNEDWREALRGARLRAAL